MLDLTAVTEATSGAPNTVDMVGGDAYAPLFTWKGCLGSWMGVREEMEEQVLHLLRLQVKIWMRG